MKKFSTLWALCETVRSVQHDLRTPLSVIVNDISVLGMHPALQAEAESLGRLSRMERQVSKINSILPELETIYQETSDPSAIIHSIHGNKPCGWIATSFLKLMNKIPATACSGAESSAGNAQKLSWRASLANSCSVEYYSLSEWLRAIDLRVEVEHLVLDAAFGDMGWIVKINDSSDTLIELIF